jgi:hypothetical protein
VLPAPLMTQLESGGEELARQLALLLALHLDAESLDGARRVRSGPASHPCWCC